MLPKILDRSRRHRRSGWPSSCPGSPPRFASRARPQSPPRQRTCCIQVNDLHNWEAWSPWLKPDPAATTAYEGPRAGTGAVFAWSGNRSVGEGRMTITESRPHELVRFELRFHEALQVHQHRRVHLHAGRRSHGGHVEHVRREHSLGQGAPPVHGHGQDDRRESSTMAWAQMKAVAEATQWMARRPPARARAADSRR